MRTSSVSTSQTEHKSQWLYKSANEIVYFDLKDEKVSEFQCIYAGYLDCFYVFPEIPRLFAKFVEMEKQLRDLNEESLEKFLNMNRSQARLCVVQDSGLWKRGKVIECFESTQEVEVWLLDSAESKKFAFGEVYKMPKKLANYPAKVLPIKLFGVVDNETITTAAENKLRLGILLDRKVIRAVVRGFDENDQPLFDLMGQDGKLVYKEMIDNEFYVQ